MAKRGAPLYRRTADDILGLIASGKLGTEFTVPEAAKAADVKEWAARKATEHLAERGLVESHHGSGYRALITPEEAAAAQVDDRPMRVQVTDLQQQVAGLREQQERLEAQLEDLYDQLGYDSPADGTSERADEPAPAARRGHTG